MISLERFYKWAESNSLNFESISEDEIQTIYLEYIEIQTEEEIAKYKATIPAIINKNKSEHNAFKKNHLSHWEDAMNTLELLIHLCIKAGSDLSASRELTTSLENENHIGLLIRLHAKACSMANEILLLLKNGFADAAQARWRSLHEVNVTLKFIHTSGAQCSERFLAHEIVDSYETMKSHRKYENRLQEKVPTNDEYEMIETMYKNSLRKFGKDFKEQYGWAIPFLPETTGKTGFQRIEKYVELDHMRPYFKWASQNIHTSTKTILKSLSMPTFEKDIINVGPSNFGLTDPAHCTAISLMQSTIWLIMTDMSENSAITMNILRSLAKSVGDEFLTVSKKFEN